MAMTWEYKVMIIPIMIIIMLLMRYSVSVMNYILANLGDSWEFCIEEHKNNVKGDKTDSLRLVDHAWCQKHMILLGWDKKK